MNRQGKAAAQRGKAQRSNRTDAKPPTDKMIAFARRLAKDRQADLPAGYDQDFEVCRRFLDQHVGAGTAQAGV